MTVREAKKLINQGEGIIRELRQLLECERSVAAGLRTQLAEAKGLLSEAWTELSAEEAATFKTPTGSSLSVRIFAFLQGWRGPKK